MRRSICADLEAGEKITMETLKQIAARAIASAKNTWDFINGNAAQEQLNAIKGEKEKYLSAEHVTENKDLVALERNLLATRCSVFHSYLPHVNSCYEPPKEDSRAQDEEALSTEANNRITWFDITKWVSEPQENSIEKLSNVYQSLCNEQCAAALIYRRHIEKCQVTLAIANHSEEGAVTVVQGLNDRLRSALRGNFPGSEYTQASAGILQDFEVDSQENAENSELEPKEDPVYVSVVTNTATEKSEKFISQGIEKLLDGFVPSKPSEEYTLVLLGTPMYDCEAELQSLYDRYTAISPFASVQCQQSISDSSTAMQGVNISGGLSLVASVTLGRYQGASETAGTSNGRTMTYTNYEVRHMLSMLETQIKRIEQCRALGTWRFAAYVFSANEVMADNVAHMYASLTQGEGSYLEQVSINSWGHEEKETSLYIRRCLSNLQHPVFCLKQDVAEEKLIYSTVTDLTTIVSGKELARALNFPQKSVPGLPVIRCAAFGRNVMSKDKQYHGDIHLGCIYHMQKQEETIPVDLNADRLAMHTFITGSTGSGKSNTIYQLLHELGAQGRKFLVVEPAKGEYRAVFGSRSDVTVYGTNPNLKEAALLRLNPFSFPENVHVYEHMDRLVEIFNVCWPMYAAMPAVLKDAIERAYVDAGWDLRRSRNRYSARLFPTFIDVLQQIDAVMDESQYSADSKGDYKGSLCTRLRSLTNGINGMIFSADELDSADLFDRNVIVDLSRVGSTETKALIMGLLVMKLQEYRMSQGGMNKTLRHATVLEEAHNLLKRTSAVQSAVGADLAGKSVEMLANAIAEMRTYGEGFIIADQAPGLLDEAVIRNTNTKIILRLPDYADRQLVGKAIGLNDDQIDELSKLKQGVAAVYQNDWVEAVLCQVDRFEPEPAEDFSKNCGKPLPSFTELPPYDAHSLLIELASGHLYVEPSDRRVLHAELPVKVKCLMFEYGKSTASDKTEKLATVAYHFLNLEPAFKDAESVSDTAQRIRMIRSKLEPFTNELSEKEAAFILTLIAYVEMKRHPEQECMIYCLNKEGGIY